MLYTDATIELAKRQIITAINNNKFAAIIGNIGAGKTHLFDQVLKQLDTSVKSVWVQDMSDQNVRIASILNALVFDLSNESPRRDMEQRSRQVARLIATQRRRVVLVIEDAHRLHFNTLSAIKRLREARYDGRELMLSVVLLGWPELEQKITLRNDVNWRVTKVSLDERAGHMTVQKRRAYIETMWPNKIAPETAQFIASLCTVPAQINHFVEDAFAEAAAQGFDILDSRTVISSSADLVRAAKTIAGGSQNQLAQAIGVSPATLTRFAQDAGAGVISTEKTSEMEAALRKIIAKAS
ncbi:MAG: ATP-binding protein [Rhodothermia bacterium]|nr:ATP-binding protein [Rhodothermia bacterium]